MKQLLYRQTSPPYGGNATRGFASSGVAYNGFAVISADFNDIVVEGVWHNYETIALSLTRRQLVPSLNAIVAPPASLETYIIPPAIPTADGNVATV